MTNPLSNLAISFSGGGYRAAAYNLGVLSYLNYLKTDNESLLKRVVMISTISGGTIVGAKYALSVSQGDSFEQFFSEMYDFLQQDALMADAFKLLNTDGNWNYKTKSKNLINAFSEIYQERLLKNAHFGDILDYCNQSGSEFMFNATDLKNGIPFRFQINGKFGNNKYSITDNATKRLFRLGDIVAASSCFPGGFEPLVYPDDFMEPTSEADFKKEIPENLNFMDGGIVDNQGIESIWLAEKRKTKDGSQFVGTYIISDVAREEVERDNVVPSKNRLISWFGQWSLRTYYYTAFLFLIISGFFIFSNNSKRGIILASVVFTFSFVIVILFTIIRRFILSSLKNTVSQKTPKFISDFSVISKVGVETLLKLFDLRINSVLRLNTIIFLARIRELLYDATYEDEKWKFRVTSNLIYTLPKYQKSELSDVLLKCVENANAMGTTLWFSDEQKINNQMLNDLIICGQATLCFNLKFYFEKRLADKQNPVEEAFIPAISTLLDNLKEDFSTFNSKPDWLLNNFKPLLS